MHRFQDVSLNLWDCAYDAEDCQIALQAAQRMSQRLGEDVAIMPDLSVVPMANADGDPLEVIRAG